MVCWAMVIQLDIRDELNGQLYSSWELEFLWQDRNWSDIYMGGMSFRLKIHGVVVNVCM